MLENVGELKENCADAEQRVIVYFYSVRLLNRFDDIMNYIISSFIIEEAVLILSKMTYCLVSHRLKMHNRLWPCRQYVEKQNLKKKS